MDTQRIRSAAHRILGRVQKGDQVVAVVSARGHTTDVLLADAYDLASQPDARELDACLSAGEQVSAALMALALREMGQEAVSLTGWQAGICTDDVYGNARIQRLRGHRIRRELQSGRVVVVAGFQGTDRDCNITTLGRGGSDTTAVALAAFLKADLCQIYTDVDGVYDRDPRKYPDARRYERISYEAMLDLVRQGAQVLHDRCVELAQVYGVPVQVLSSFRPGPGTMVCDTVELFSPADA